MTGAYPMRALKRNSSGLPKMLVVGEQLDELIGFTSGWTTISNDLKQGLLKLHKLLALAKKKYDQLREERSAATKSATRAGTNN